MLGELQHLALVIGNQVQRCLRLAGIDGQRQLPNEIPKAPTCAQHDGLLRQRRGKRALGHQGWRQGLCGHRLRKPGGAQIVMPGPGIAAQLAQHGAGLHRSQLVLVAEQNQLGTGWQGSQQGGHHLQVNHRGFVDDHDVDVKQIAGMKTKLPGVGPCPEQRMQGFGSTHALGEGRQVQAAAQAGAELLQRRVDGLAQARRRFAGGRRQGHPQPSGLIVQGKQQGQQPRSGIGFSRAWPAGNHGQASPQGYCTGKFLPIHQSLFGHWPQRVGQAFVSGFKPWFKQTIQPVPGQCLVQALAACDALQHGTGDLGLVTPIAAQVEQGLGLTAPQYQRLSSIWRIRLACRALLANTAHQRAGAQPIQPASQLSRQVLPQPAQGWLGQVWPGQEFLGLGDD